MGWRAEIDLHRWREPAQVPGVFSLIQECRFRKAYFGRDLLHSKRVTQLVEHAYGCLVAGEWAIRKGINDMKQRRELAIGCGQ